MSADAVPAAASITLLGAPATDSPAPSSLDPRGGLRSQLSSVAIALAEHDARLCALTQALAASRSERVDGSAAVEERLQGALAALREDMLRRFNAVATTAGAAAKELAAVRGEVAAMGVRDTALTTRISALQGALEALEREVMGGAGGGEGLAPF